MDYLCVWFYCRLFPTCQVRVVRFYVSCLVLLLVLLLLSLSSSSSCSTATRDPQCSLSDLNHDHPRPVFPAGPQPRPSTPSVPCRTSTTTIHAQCSLPDLNWAWMVVVEVRQGTLGVDGRGWGPAGNTGRGWSWLRSGREHVGRYGTKNVQKKVRKNVRRYAR